MSIDKAEAAVAALEDQRKALVIERQEQDDELKRVAFLAHVQGDVEARKRLTELREEAIRRDQKFKEIEAATATAREKLAQAQAAEVRQAALENAEKLADVASLLAQVGRDLDAACFGITESGRVMKELIDIVHGLGLANPNAHQMHSLGWRALASALINTPWAREFPPVPPNDRKSFEQITAAWAQMIENAAERQVGEQQQEVA
jgi:hypothetical protein